MRWRLLLACLAFALASAAQAEERFLGVAEDEIRRVIELGYNLDPALEPAIAHLKAAHPESPTPDLLDVGRLYWMQRYVGIDAALTAEFEAAALQTLKKCEAYEKRHSRDLDAEYAAAMAETILVMHYVDHQRWWPAFWKTRSSMRAMKRISKEDPTYADAALPLGMANCYLADAPSFLKPLAFLMRFDGDMEKGLAYMEQSKRGGLFTSVDAGYYLAEIKAGLLKDAEAARAEMEALVERFPGNIRFQVSLAEMERACGLHPRAFARTRRILKQPEIRRFPALRLEGTLSLCWSALASGEFVEARDAGERAERFAREHPALGWLVGWALVARAEAANALGDPEGAVELFESIGSDFADAHQRAQVRVEEIRAARQG